MKNKITVENLKKKLLKETAIDIQIGLGLDDEDREVLENHLKFFMDNLLQAQAKDLAGEECSNTHDYGYGNDYIPQNSEGKECSYLKCIHCGKTRQEVIKRGEKWVK